MSKYSLLIISVFVVLISGCTLMLGDTVKRDMAELNPGSCPDLSGKYVFVGTALLGLDNFPAEKRAGILIDLLPTDQKEKVDDIYENFFNFNKPYRIDFRKKTMPSYPKRFDYALDGNKTKGAYVELKPIISSNEYVVNVYSNSKLLLGEFQTKLMDKNSVCHDNKYITFYQEPSAHMAGEDEAFTMRRSSQEVMFYRSESGALVREAVGRTKTVIFGIIPFTQQDPGTIVTFPQIR